MERYIGKSARKPWVNEYGYDEGYTYKGISSYLSGHLWRGSAMETDNSCGNCDGANCDSCRRMYVVTTYGEPRDVMTEWGWTERADSTLDRKVFTDREEAEAYYESIV